MILIRNKDEQDLITRIRDIAAGAANPSSSVEAYASEVLTLKRQIADLEISKEKKEESFARRERDLQHMIGLEKTRQEQELALSKREATLGVREENLKHERQEFERQLAFNTERFTKMEDYMKQTFAQVMDRLPQVNVMKVEHGVR